MIVGNFGACGRNNRQKRAFANVGIADKSDVRYGFKFEKNALFLGFFAALRKSGSLTARRLESCVAFAAYSAAKSHDACVFVEHIGDDSARFLVAYNRPARDFYDKIGRALTVAEFTRTVTAVLGFIKLCETEVGKRTHIRVDDKYYVSALAAVAAVRTAVCDVFFGVERRTSVAAVTRFNEYFCVIYKHYCSPLNLLIMLSAAFLPAPIARITVAAPVTASPPA